MLSGFPVEAIASLATIVAALIAAALSFVNLTLTKELKTSEFRQTWIDALREDLASFLAAARAFARTVDLAQLYSPDHIDRTMLPITKEKISDLRHEAAVTFYRIKLRLNPNETEHIELLRLLEVAVAEQNKMLTDHTNSSETLAAIERVSDYCRPVLRKEWLVVKKGELAFRLVRNWIAPIIIFGSIIFIVFVLTREYPVVP